MRAAPPVLVEASLAAGRRKLAAVGGNGGARRKQSRSPSKSCKETRVSFKNKVSGKMLVGTLTQSTDPALAKRTVVLCHGFASHRDGFHFPAIAEQLARRGIGSLRFDFAGNGDSDGTFEFGNYAAEAEDVRAAVQYLRANGHTVSGLVGHSKGGNSVLVYASIYDDVPVINIAGRFDLKRGISERFGADIFLRIAQEKQLAMEQARDDGVIVAWTLTKWSLQDRLDTDMRAAAAKIRHSEVLTVHGSKDRVIPVEDSRQWGAHIANHELLVVDGADHSFLMPEHSERMIAAVVERCTG